jgi:hypothetical protein
MQALRQFVEYVGQLVTPAALLAGLGPDLTRGGPEAERTITNREHRRDHSAPLELAQHRLPTLGALPVTVLDRQQLLLPIGARADHHQGAEPVVIQTDVEVNPVHPDIDILAPAQVALAKVGIFFLPAGGQPRDIGC